MSESSKKVTNIIKFLLPLIIENWGKIAIYLSGITISGVVAGLGNFIDVFSSFINIHIPLNIPLWLIIAILPVVLYGIISSILKIVNNLKKPSFLKFTSMEYTDTKNNLYRLKWNYELYNKEYVVRNIYPVCCNCGCELTYIKDSDYIYCPVCRDNAYKIFDEKDAVIKIIWHRIRNGLY